MCTMPVSRAQHRAETERTCLILRTQVFGERERAFLAKLQADTGFSAAVAADETRTTLDCAPYAKISVTPARAASLGLYCPADFGWRCGDYALYLARHGMPEMDHFWIVEPDVRFAFSNYADIFGLFDNSPEADLISPDLRLSGADHLWHPTMRQRTPNVYRCCFGLARFSARALDLCLAERRRDRTNPWARLMWPNDESFTASIVIAAGLDARDMNSFGRVLYTVDTFGFFTVRQGETFDDWAQPGLIYHPVLWGEDYSRKVTKMARGVPLHEVIRLKILRGIMIKRYQRWLGLDRIVGRQRPVPRLN
jgi:hypothetical protein